MKTNDTYTLTMDAETAHVVSRVCEFYARILMGQWDEISWEMVLQGGSFVERRESCDHYLNLARAVAFPKLAPNQSLGIGNHRTIDTAWHTYEAVRYALAWQEHPEGGDTVNFNKPLKFSDAPMPKCAVQRAEGKEA